MVSLRCAGIVYDSTRVVLVRKKGAEKWGLPERNLTETEDAVACIRRCVLTQSGHRAAELALYKIQSQAKTSKNGALLRFIFGCKLGETQLQAIDADFEMARFTPDEVIKIADKGQFKDLVLLELVQDYYYHLGVPTKKPSSPLPTE